MGIIGIEKLILNFHYKMDFIENNAVYKLGASIALA